MASHLRTSCSRRDDIPESGMAPLQEKKIPTMPKKSVRHLFSSTDWVSKVLTAMLTAASTIKPDLMEYILDIFIFILPLKHTI